MFCRAVQAAMDRRAVQDGTIGSGWKISARQGEVITVTNELGDREDARSVIVAVRQLILEKEPTHFYSIANIVERTVRDDQLRDANRTNRESWKRVMRGSMGLVVNGESFQGLGFFNLYAYGGVFHSDPALVKSFEALEEVSMTEAMDAMTSQPPEYLEAPAAAMAGFLAAVDERFGSMVGYVTGIGVSAATIDQLRAALVV